jgi:hypothetical protein
MWAAGGALLGYGLLLKDANALRLMEQERDVLMRRRQARLGAVAAGAAAGDAA